MVTPMPAKMLTRLPAALTARPPTRPTPIQFDPVRRCWSSR